MRLVFSGIPFRHWCVWKSLSVTSGLHLKTALTFIVAAVYVATDHRGRFIHSRLWIVGKKISQRVDNRWFVC